MEVNIAHHIANNLIKLLLKTSQPSAFLTSPVLCPSALCFAALPSSLLRLSIFSGCPHGELPPPFRSLSKPSLTREPFLDHSTLSLPSLFNFPPFYLSCRFPVHSFIICLSPLDRSMSVEILSVLFPAVAFII